MNGGGPSIPSLSVIPPVLGPKRGGSGGDKVDGKSSSSIGKLFRHKS